MNSGAANKAKSAAKIPCVIIPDFDGGCRAGKLRFVARMILGGTGEFVTGKLKRKQITNAWCQTLTDSSERDFLTL
jgi:hypothetical protein